MINERTELRRKVQRLLRENYPMRKRQLELLPERIATEKARLTAIRSSVAESTGGSQSDRQERDIAIMVTIGQLKAELTAAKMDAKVIERILKTLSPEEYRCVELCYLEQRPGAIEQLCEELYREKSSVYDILNTARDKIALLYWAE
jgi:hypothetical protein